jgi:hypothetical protein
MIARMRPSRLLPLLLSLPLPGCILGVGNEDTGNDDELAMDEGTAGTGSVDGGECFVPPHCDPLSPDCAPGELCSAIQGSFDCTPVPEGTELVGEGEPCGNASCDAGLVCVSTCNGGAGCCVLVCDLEQPQCPMDRPCTPYYAEGSTQCYAHVGVCEPA